MVNSYDKCLYIDLQNAISKYYLFILDSFMFKLMKIQKKKRIVIKEKEFIYKNIKIDNLPFFQLFNTLLIQLYGF